MTRATHRAIYEHWVIRGTLELTSPTHFGNGESDSFTDMPVLLNEVDGRPLLPGTSIAGALRNYLRELEKGFGHPAPSGSDKVERELLATQLFGAYRRDDADEQSPLVIHDSVGKLAEMELRDGVAIHDETRTAADEQKFDIQLLGAGTTFDLTFELAVSKDHPNRTRERLLEGLALALQGLAGGDITLGARKRRGYGRCKVDKWSVMHFNMQNKEQFLAWLAYGHDGWTKPVGITSDAKIAAALGIPEPKLDNRKWVKLEATFGLDSTLLIRSGFGESDTGPDSVHMHASRKGKPVPVVPGTSWAGGLRHRAYKIVRTIWGKDDPKCAQVVEGMFGPASVNDKHAYASRIQIAESEVTKASNLVQTRVKIDRFTGGAYEGALFTEQPLVGTPDSEVKLELSLRVPHNREPDPAELGLLLLLLKDLWTGDLPIGGESGIGRGRLKGKFARFTVGPDQWEITETQSGTLDIQGDQERLEALVKAFNPKGE